MIDREQALWREIVEQVPGQYVNHHGVWLVGIGVAPAVVAFLRERNVLILGFEGFEVDGTSIRPELEAIADFSAVAGPFWDAIEVAAAAATEVLGGTRRQFTVLRVRRRVRGQRSRPQRNGSGISPLS